LALVHADLSILLGLLHHDAEELSEFKFTVIVFHILLSRTPEQVGASSSPFTPNPRV
jgi:hypothetical protein